MVRILITLIAVMVLPGCVQQLTSMATIKVVQIEEVALQCEKGEVKACQDAGRRYRYGQDAPKDIDLAMKYYDLGCKGKNRDACKAIFDIGWDRVESERYTRDNANLLEIFKVSCTGTYGPACSSLAYNYQTGKGVGKDPVKALELYEKGCANRSPSGCEYAGNMYVAGKYVTRNPTKAKALFEKGCTWKNSGACSGLGHLYLKGDGVKQDYAQAHMYLVQSCDKAPGDNNSAGCFSLAKLYDQGQGCQQDKTEAVRLFKQACYVVKPKNAEACVKLAQAYQTGMGIKADANGAHEYFRLACTLGNQEGCIGQYTDECDRLKLGQACEWLKKHGLY